MSYLGGKSFSINSGKFFFYKETKIVYKMIFIDKIKKNSIEENVFQKRITEFEALIVE